MSRGRICLFVPYLYPVASHDGPEFAGGIEVMLWLVARGLAARGFEVSVVTCDYGQPPRLVIDGVTLIRAYRPFVGLPVLRFFHPRLSRSLQALHRADAEIYFVQGSGIEAGIACDVARTRRAAFVFLAAHDNDVMKTLPFQTNIRDRWWYRRALRGARLLLAQTETQRRMFRENFGLASEIVSNPVELPPSTVDPGREGVAVWLGTYKPSKRPEWFTELARRLPAHRFVMWGLIPPPPLGREPYEAALAVARGQPNLEVRAEVARRGGLGEVFGAAAVLVHTSSGEGFPNTLLEAWSYGVPTITAFDPDGIVGRQGLGAVVRDLPTLVSEVGRWLTDPARRRAAGLRARVYVEAHHAPESVYARLGALLDPIVAEVRAGRRR